MKLSRLTSRFLRLSVVRILLAVVVLIVAVIARDITIGLLGRLLSLGRQTPQIWLSPSKAVPDVHTAVVIYSLSALVIMVSLGFGAYGLYARIIERRVPSELAWTTGPRELGLGSLLGSGLVFTVVAVLAALGYFRISGTRPWLVALPTLATAATAACMEELALRGIVFRIVEERLGTWIALALSAALFGGLHAMNPGASWVTTLTVAATAGLLLGAAYVLTHRVWLAIGVHFAVNATQGGVLGLPVSGLQNAGLLQSALSGPTVWTGGAFGIEASAILLVPAVTLGVIMLSRAVRAGRIVRPFWMQGA